MWQRALEAALALAALVGGACVAHRQEPVRTPAAPPPLLLISIDGVRYDYLERADTPALDRLAAGGLKADALVPVFPTKTFPTHYAIVTGLYAESTGVVANSMWDPGRRARFSLRDRDAVGDGFWYGGEPIWVTAQRQGLKAAAYFWPGSEAQIRGVRPTWWTPYEHDTPHEERVAQILAWLDLPAGERPSVLTLYFSSVDSAGHRFGPESPEVIPAIEDVDSHLGRLLDGLEARGLLDAMHILVVSDHGMAATDAERTIMLDDYLDLSRLHVSDWGPAAHIWAGDMGTDEIVAALDNAHPRLRVWRRNEIPERYHFRDHLRIPDVLAEADLGWLISSRSYMASLEGHYSRGMHGWDPRHLEMHGIFLAHGPAFTPGDRMGLVEAIHLYELMAALLGLEPSPNDGRLAAFAGHVTGVRPPR